MTTQVEVRKNNNENANSVLRRFQKKVRGAGFTKIVRGKRYYSRVESKLRRKQSALVRIGKTADYNKLDKLGKTEEKTR
ncbi:MAG: 30S ribosomal protein S21 [Candidatus Pacebacteria bacterium]|nr:30S ribosomal protein S21 [Candidatus Paceibacterota bacterium]